MYITARQYKDPSRFCVLLFPLSLSGPLTYTLALGPTDGIFHFTYQLLSRREGLPDFDRGRRTHRQQMDSLTRLMNGGAWEKLSAGARRLAFEQ